MWIPTKTQLLAMTGAPLLFALSACGGGSGAGTHAGSNAGTSPVAKTSTAKTAASGLQVASTSLGKVLVNAKGMTVYVFSADSPGKSTCDASCLVYWPAVPALAKGAKPAGVTGGLGSTTTPSGQPIETVAGSPVYTFVQDKAPGDVTGQGMNIFGGIWYAVSPSGQPVTAGGSASQRSGAY
jgi:predicted lipoprotein with Yx(FWY)xxD motif